MSKTTPDNKCDKKSPCPLHKKKCRPSIDFLEKKQTHITYASCIVLYHTFIYIFSPLQIVKHRSHTQNPSNPFKIKNGEWREGYPRIPLPKWIGIRKEWSCPNDQSALATFKSQERGGNVYPTTYRSTVSSCPGGISELGGRFSDGAALCASHSHSAPSSSHHCRFNSRGAFR